MNPNDEEVDRKKIDSRFHGNDGNLCKKGNGEGNIN